MPEYVVNRNPFQGWNVLHLYPEPEGHDGYPELSCVIRLGEFDTWHEAVAEAGRRAGVGMVRPCRRCCERWWELLEVPGGER